MGQEFVESAGGGVLAEVVVIPAGVCGLADQEVEQSASSPVRSRRLVRSSSVNA